MKTYLLQIIGLLMLLIKKHSTRNVRILTITVSAFAIIVLASCFFGGNESNESSENGSESSENNIENSENSENGSEAEHKSKAARLTIHDNDLIFFIGADSKEIIETFGQPSPDSIEGHNLIYPSTGEAGLILSLNSGVVEKISLKSADWKLIGLRTVNSMARVDKVMNGLGAIDFEQNKNPDTGETSFPYSFSYRGGAFNLVFTSNPGENTISLEAGTGPARIEKPHTTTHDE